MPRGVECFFADHMLAISKYKRNALHEAKREEDVAVGYGLGVVYEIAYGESIMNAHSSL